MLASGCSSTDKLDGRLFLSAIESSDGTAIGVAVDFIPTAGTFSPNRVKLAIDIVGEQLLVGSQPVSSVCMSLPARRLNLFAFDGKLDPTSRVTARAFRVDVQAADVASGGSGGTSGASVGGGEDTAGSAGMSAGTGGMSAGTGGMSAGGGSGGSVGAGGATSSTLLTSAACEDLVLLDDAVWPTRGAQVGPREGTGGSFTVGGTNGASGSGGTGGTGGGVGGAAGEAGAGGEAGVGGAPPDGGAGGAGGADAGAAGALNGQGGN